MSKWRWAFGALLLALWLLPEPLWAADAADVLPDMSELERSIDAVGRYLGDYLPGDSLSELWRQARQGELALSPQLFAAAAAGAFTREIAGTLNIFGQLLTLAVFTMLLARFEEKGVGKLAASVVYLAFMGLAVQVFRLCGDTAGEAIGLMSDFVYALLPVLLTLLVSLGGASSVALFNPALLFAVSVSLHLLRYFVLPLLYISGALTLFGRLPAGVKLSGLAKLARDLGMGVLAVLLSLFTAGLGVLGLSSAALDGLGFRAVKSASGVFIPVVGRTIADVLDTVVGTALLLKNVIGVAGIAVLALLLLLPAVKILLLYLAFRLAGAVCEPLGDAALAELLGALAQVVVLFFAVVAAGAIFFFFLISIIIGMGNIMLALR